MQPNMAQVLNTLAHEIRTPLAVSQGYLKLYVDGRLSTPHDQQRALNQTREALGVIAVLCADIGKVSALVEAGSPALPERLDATRLAADLRDAIELAHATASGGPPAGRIATNAPKDLVKAIAIVIKSAFDEAKHEPHHYEWHADGEALVVRAGTAEGVRALPVTADGDGAAAVNVVRGGKGLTLIWAAFVLEQHGIHTWTHQAHKASMAVRIPLVRL
jgi:signal transduction histidine kinase